MKKNIGMLSVLTIRPFLFLWLGQIFSQIAINMMNFILILRSYELTFSSTAVSGLILFINLPMITLGLLAGGYVDRINKKSVLILTNVLRSILMLSLIVSINTLPLIYFIVLLVSTVTLFFVPAEVSTIPQIVPKKMLLWANAIFTISLYSSILVGYILAGPFIKILGFSNALLFLSALFLIAGFFVSVLPKDTAGPKQVKSVLLNDITKDLYGAYQLLKRSKVVLESLLLLTFSQGMISVLAVIIPGYAKKILAIDVEDVSFFILAPAALGMVLGAIVLSNIGHKFSKRFLINFGTLLSGIAIFAMPFSNRLVSKFWVIRVNDMLPEALTIDHLHIVIFLAVLLGFANALITISANTALQDKTHIDFLGRVYGAFTSLSALFSIIPAFVVGGLADIFNVTSVLMIFGFCITLFALYRAFISKYSIEK